MKKGLIGILLLCTYSIFQIRAQSISSGQKKEKRISFKKGGDGNGYRIVDSTDLCFLLDTMRFRRIYNDAKWRQYCLCCMDTIYFTHEACLKFGYKEFTLLGEEYIELEKVVEYNKYISGLDAKQILMKYGLSFSPIPKNIDSPYMFINFLSGDVVKTYKHDRQYYYNYVFPEICYTGKYTDTPCAITREVEMVLLYHNYSGDCITRHMINVMEDPMQPDVILYIREHANKINRWFYNEAKKRGVFDSVKYPPAIILQEIEHNRTAHKDCYDPPPRSAEGPPVIK